jgi:hypothetical protein
MSLVKVTWPKCTANARHFARYWGGVLFVISFSMATILGAKSHTPSAEPTRDEKRIPTFRDGDGMTEIENMIVEHATACLTQYEVEGKIFYYPTSCAVVDKLRAALLKISETEPLLDFLIANDFRCQKANNEEICRNEFGTIQNPLWDGKKVAPDMRHTFITEVAFRQAKSGPLSVEDINVKFTHFEKRDPN